MDQEKYAKQQKDHNKKFRGPNYRSTNELKVNKIDNIDNRSNDSIEVIDLNKENQQFQKLKDGSEGRRITKDEMFLADTKYGEMVLEKVNEQAARALGQIGAMIEGKIKNLESKGTTPESLEAIKYLKGYIMDISSLAGVPLDVLRDLNNPESVKNLKLSRGDVENVVMTIQNDPKIHEIEKKYDLQIVQGIVNTVGNNYKTSRMFVSKDGKEKWVFLSPAVKGLYDEFQKDWNANHAQYGKDTFMSRVKDEVSDLISELANNNNKSDHQKLSFVLTLYAMHKLGMISEKDAKNDINIIHNSQIGEALSYISKAVTLITKVLRLQFESLNLPSGSVNFEAEDRFVNSKSPAKVASETMILDLLKSGKRITPEQTVEFQKALKEIFNSEVDAKHGTGQKVRQYIKDYSVVAQKDKCTFDGCKVAHSKAIEQQNSGVKTHLRR